KCITRSYYGSRTSRTTISDDVVRGHATDDDKRCALTLTEDHFHWGDCQGHWCTWYYCDFNRCRATATIANQESIWSNRDRRSGYNESHNASLLINYYVSCIGKGLSNGEG